jgi:hypothetical protein
VFSTSLPSPVQAGSSCTTTSNVALAPTASVASVGQVTLCPAAVPPAVELPNVTCAGSASETTTSVASARPTHSARDPVSNHVAPHEHAWLLHRSVAKLDALPSKECRVPYDHLRRRIATRARTGIG